MPVFTGMTYIQSENDSAFSVYQQNLLSNNIIVDYQQHCGLLSTLFQKTSLIITSY